MKYLSILLLSLFPSIALAAPAWKVDSKNSELSFRATQNGAPVTGAFPTFASEIYFAPEELAGSKVKVTVELASVAVPYAEVATMLKTDDWFAAATFPQAVFEAAKFTKTGDNNYTAEGTLRLRDKTVPVTLAFTLEEYSKDKAVAKGSVTLKRLDFGVGQGQWKETNAVKNEVLVEFKIEARP